MVPGTCVCSTYSQSQKMTFLKGKSQMSLLYLKTLVASHIQGKVPQSPVWLDPLPLLSTSSFPNTHPPTTITTIFIQFFHSVPAIQAFFLSLEYDVLNWICFPVSYLYHFFSSFSAYSDATSLPSPLYLKYTLVPVTLSSSATFFFIVLITAFICSLFISLLCGQGPYMSYLCNPHNVSATQ